MRWWDGIRERYGRDRDEVGRDRVRKAQGERMGVSEYFFDLILQSYLPIMAPDNTST